jgi:hypothetical protein
VSLFFFIFQTIKIKNKTGAGSALLRERTSERLRTHVPAQVGQAVRLLVLVQVAGLAEAPPTARHVAHEGPLPRVHPPVLQVVAALEENLKGKVGR